MWRSAYGLMFCVAAVGCGRNSASVSIEFPNEAARDAVRRIMVGAYDPAGSSSPSDRTCSSFVGKAAMGETPIGAVNFGVDRCSEGSCEGDWFGDLVIPDVPKGPRIIYALAFSEVEETAVPFLEGCSDQFDSKGGGKEANSVPVQMQLVLPDTARILLKGGSPQVGHPGEITLAPLAAQVVAEDPRESGGTYPVPGVEVVFTVEDATFNIVDGGARKVEYSDRAGNVSINVQYPAQVAYTNVQAVATPLMEAEGVTIFKQDYSLTVVNPSDLSVINVVQRPNRGPGSVTQYLAMGDSDGLEGGVAVLDCEGGNELGCTPGATAEPPFGTAALSVVQNVMTAGASELGPIRQGILPAGLVVEDVDSRNQGLEISVLHSRRNDNGCQQRTCTAGQPCKCWEARNGGPCPCEGAEVRMWRVNGQNLELVQTHALTASNAVDMAAVRQPERFQTGMGLAIAGQGRRPQTRPCADICIGYLFEDEIPLEIRDDTQPCLPDADGLPTNCGCPPQESCEAGVCVARDKIIDLLFDRQDSQESVARGIENFGGCRERANFCSNATAPDTNAPASICACPDAVARGEYTPLTLDDSCGSAKDRCGCEVPQSIQVGSSDSPALPFSVTAGQLAEGRRPGAPDNKGWQFVVPSAGGLELYRGDGQATPPWEWMRTPSINTPIHFAAVADLDLEIEDQVGSDQLRFGDIIWFSRSECTDQGSFIDECPILSDLPDLAVERGCLGTYYSAGVDSVADGDAACLRHRLDFEPTSMCLGSFGNDNRLDAVLTSRGRSQVYIFRGDGRGGLLDPPDIIDLPAGTVGGPVVCGDLDGDGRDEVVVADYATGALHVLGR